MHKKPFLAALIALWAFAPTPLWAESKAVGEIKEYTATQDDTLVKIARDFNVGFVELRAANPHVDPVAARRRDGAYHSHMGSDPRWAA
ncbi:MAG: LysM peptidoglycan-binding domain-containing protein [Alphaproteobacteria bacterium]|nr:LysM peptidoglycan-binding domain-containing protein [Alphaproteobacteria bacterium]